MRFLLSQTTHTAPTSHISPTGTISPVPHRLSRGACRDHATQVVRGRPSATPNAGKLEGAFWLDESFVCRVQNMHNGAVVRTTHTSFAQVGQTQCCFSAS